MALRFSGTARVNVGSNTTLDTGAASVVCAWGAWIYPEATTTGRIVSRVALERYVEWGTTLKAHAQRATTDCLSEALLTNYATWRGVNRWHYICARLNTAGVNQSQVILLGNDLDLPVLPSAFVSRNVGSGAITTDVGLNMYVGNDSGFAVPFPGRIEALTFWNGVIPDLDEIFAHYRDSRYRARMPRRLRKVAGIWVFNRTGFQGRVPDLSGNGNHGAPNGTTVAESPVLPEALTLAATDPIAMPPAVDFTPGMPLFRKARYYQADEGASDLVCALDATDIWEGDRILAFAVADSADTITQTAGLAFNSRAGSSFSVAGVRLATFERIAAAQVAGGGVSADAGATVTFHNSNPTSPWGVIIVPIGAAHATTNTLFELEVQTTAAAGSTQVVATGGTPLGTNRLQLTIVGWKCGTNGHTNTLEDSAVVSAGPSVDGCAIQFSTVSPTKKNAGLAIYVNKSPPTNGVAEANRTAKLNDTGRPAAFVALSLTLRAMAFGTLGAKLFNYPYVMAPSRSSYQYADIYWPTAGSFPCPAIVFSHGGISGDKNLDPAKNLAHWRLLAKGAALVAINYRPPYLSDDWRPGGHDGRAATRHYKAQASVYGFSAANIRGWGASAGAQGVLGQTFWQDEATLTDLTLGESGTSDKFERVGAWFPPSHMSPNNAGMAALGLTPTNDVCAIGSDQSIGMGSPNSPALICAEPNFDGYGGVTVDTTLNTYRYNRQFPTAGARLGTAIANLPSIFGMHGRADNRICVFNSKNDQTGAGAGLPKGWVDELVARGGTPIYVELPLAGHGDDAHWLDDVSNPYQTEIRTFIDWLAAAALDLIPTIAVATASARVASADVSGATSPAAARADAVAAALPMTADVSGGVSLGAARADATAAGLVATADVSGGVSLAVARAAATATALPASASIGSAPGGLPTIRAACLSHPTYGATREDIEA